MTTEWDKQTFTECVQPFRVDRGKQVKAREYLSSGKYPIVDQGQGLVAGWTDSEAAVIRDGLPYVVFGDHTRLLKYVDFPFALGADGTKLIKPKKDINPLYFYFHLLCFDIPSRGYSRHYRLLKERVISLPPLPEQKKVAAVLLKIQRAIETQEKIIQSVRDLKKSTMQHVFTRGLRGEKTKMTEFGSIPESWQVEPLGQYCTVQTGIAKGRKIADHEAIELPYIRVANVQDGHLDLTEMKTIRLRALEKERYSLQDGDIVLTEGGDFDKLGWGFVWEGQVSDCVHQNHVFAVRPDKSRLLPHYLAYLVQSLYGKTYFLKVAHKTTNLACINTTKLKRFPVVIPGRREQEDLVHSIGTIDVKVVFHESKKSVLQDLFKTTLNKLMAGAVRVQDLDIDVSEVEG